MTDLAIDTEVSFHREHPDYAGTAVLDELRATDFARLDRDGHVYLDYTGGGMFASSQVAEHMELLASGVFGNPHSINPTSAASGALVERARACVLEFFKASPEEYEAIFTPNATGALRLVGEAYPFRPGDRFLLTFDNHNSVNGIREFARARGADTTYIPSIAPDLRVDESLLPRYLTDTIGDHHNLFAYPAQSNFSGVQHPLGWIDEAHAHGWDVLLDAAAYVPTNTLDLSVCHPDFVAISFYKMFGWPTGVGCLLARRQALAKLERPWFSGGTIVTAFVQREYFHSAPGAAQFEDGTVNYLNLPAVEIGLRYLDRIGIDTVHRRVGALGQWLIDQLGSLAALGRSGCDDDLRAAIVATARCHDRVQLPSSRWQDHRRAIRRPDRRAAQRVPSHRLLLQPRSGRGRVHDLARDARRRRVRKGHEPRRLRGRDRPAFRWRDPRVARSRLELPRRSTPDDVRRAIHRPRRGTRPIFRRASAAEISRVYVACAGATR